MKGIIMRINPNQLYLIEYDDNQITGYVRRVYSTGKIIHVLSGEKLICGGNLSIKNIEDGSEVRINTTSDINLTPLSEF